MANLGFVSLWSTWKSCAHSSHHCSLQYLNLPSRLVLQQQQYLGRRFGTSKMHLSHKWLLWLLSVLMRWFCFCCWFVVNCYSHCVIFLIVLFWCALLVYILVLQLSRWGRESCFFLLCLSTWCLIIVVWLFLTMPWVCLQFVIVVFPDHTHFFVLSPWEIPVLSQRLSHLENGTFRLASEVCLDLWTVS